MNFILFLAIGVLTGWIATELTKGVGFRLLSNITGGVVGSLFGGFLFDMFDVDAYGLLGRLIMAMLGAGVVLFAMALFASRTTHRPQVP